MWAGNKASLQAVFFYERAMKMSLVRYGGGVVQMSGSIAGNTFARNRSGNYVRARTTPVNPQSALQTAVRASIAFLTAAWSQTLTALQRAAWNNYADNVAMKNRLGETIYLSGFNHFIRSNVLIKVYGGTVVAAGPTALELPEQDPTFAIAASEATQVITVTYDDTLEWCDEDGGYLWLFQGLPQNPQRNFFNGPWKQGVPVEGDGAVPPTSTESFAAVMPFQETQHLWMYARIQRADGRLSEAFRADCFCAA